MNNFSLSLAADEPIADSTSVSPSGFSHSFNHRGESFSLELSREITPSLSLIERSIKRATLLEVAELTFEEEPIASPDGSKNLKLAFTWPLVLLANVRWEVSSVIFEVSVSSSSEKPCVVPPFPFVVLSKIERDPPVVVTLVCTVVTWVEIHAKGEVVARVTCKANSALGIMGGVTVVVVAGTAAVAVVCVSVGSRCVVIATRTVGGKGGSFLVGGGMVGVGGLNLVME